MRHVIFITFFIFATVSLVDAGVYLVLEPGISTRKDADRTLGEQRKEVLP